MTGRGRLTGDFCNKYQNLKSLPIYTSSDTLNVIIMLAILSALDFDRKVRQNDNELTGVSSTMRL